ncbi:MAG: glutathione S-transferase family protein [Xanthobacteraceae bacterium]|nr:MAG: glutathione S-transferase family protein [Xanthobacteraceae bacterium]
MKLIWSPTSPFARKVRVAAYELGLHERLTLEALNVQPGKLNPEYATSVNPLRKIPALILDDGEAIVDSLIICDYLDALAGGDRIIPAANPERARVLTAHSIANGVIDTLVQLRYETWLRPEELRWQVWSDDLWDRVVHGLSWLEQRAGAPRDRFDLAAITTACMLGYLDLRFAGAAWREKFPALAAFEAAVRDRPSLGNTAPPQG